MTEEQRSRLKSRIEQNRKGNCYIHDRDADAIDAALAEIDRQAKLHQKLRRLIDTAIGQLLSLSNGAAHGTLLVAMDALEGRD